MHTPRPRPSLFLLALGFLLPACGAKTTSPSTSTITSTGTAAGGSNGSSPLSVVQFSPAAGSVNAIPTSVAITFDESALDQNADSHSVTTSTNYVFNCGSYSYYATSASYNGAGTVTVSLPSVSITAGSSCSLVVSSNIQDTSGNALSGNQTASWVLASGSGILSVSSFSPPSETVSTMPTSVDVTFSESSLDTSADAYSALNSSNYSYVCGGTTFSPTSASLVGSGIVALSLPAISIAAGGACVLTVSSSVHDGSGNPLGGASQVTYTQSGVSSSGGWNEAASTTLTSAVGNAYTGWAFYDVASTGLVLTGITVHSGSFVDQLNGIWTSGFNGSNQIYGPTYGGSGGNPDGNLSCPSNMRLTGLFGTYDSQIDSIGILCQTVDRSQSYQSSPVGGSGANSFQMSCPAGLFATDLAGVAGNYVQQLQLGCR